MAAGVLQAHGWVASGWRMTLAYNSMEKVFKEHCKAFLFYL